MKNLLFCLFFLLPFFASAQQPLDFKGTTPVYIQAVVFRLAKIQCGYLYSSEKQTKVVDTDGDYFSFITIPNLLNYFDAQGYQFVCFIDVTDMEFETGVHKQILLKKK